MREITDPAEMRAACATERRAGRRLGLVPTMGYLHAGHLALIKAVQARCDSVAVSIFVNPLQFGPGEDFDRYPRDLERDRVLARQAAVDLLWVPSAQAMYPEPPSVTVSPGRPGEILEGAARPGHFTGVLTVVLKLFAVTDPDLAVLGRKDVQQAFLVQRMVRDLNLRVEIVVAPTVREADGLALSSRNVHLDADARQRALVLPRALARAVAEYRGGERRAGSIVAAAWSVLAAAEGVATDYLSCVDPETFTPHHAATDGTLLAAAIRVGGLRLIDNVALGPGLEADVRVGG